MARDVLVIGCGCIGLSSGILLLQEGYRVTIWAKDLPPNTTSNKAAALWYPFHAYPADKVARWSTETLEYFFKNVLSDKTSGTLAQTVYEIFKKPNPADPEWKKHVTTFRRPEKHELPPGYVDGYAVDAFIMDTDLYMDWLVKKFVSLGGVIEQRTIHDLREPMSAYDIIVNCPGLGARELCNDKAVYPSRGQIMVIKHNGLTNSLMDDDPTAITYAIPRINNIVLGGTMGEHEYHLEPTEADKSDILAKAAKLHPSLKNVEVIQHKVGLRPSRHEIRLEPEWFEGGRKLVVHNYGHGGSGFTVSWGCALEVVQIVKQNQDLVKRDQHEAKQDAKDAKGAVKLISKM